MKNQKQKNKNVCNKTQNKKHKKNKLFALLVARNTLSRCESSFIHPKNSILSSEIKLLKIVGKGTCGEVWKANWNGNTVAVKKIFRSLISDSALEEFKSEAKILRLFFI